MNKKGYTLPELLVVLGIVGVIFLVFVTKTSHALEEIDNTSDIAMMEENVVKNAALKYAESIKESFKEEKTKYFSAQEIMDAGYLINDEAYKSEKIKITYDETTDSFTLEII